MMPKLIKIFIPSWVLILGIPYSIFAWDASGSSFSYTTLTTPTATNPSATGWTTPASSTSSNIAANSNVISLPTALQNIFNKIDISGSGSLSATNIDQGLNAALDYTGNDKYLLIPQFTAILNSSQLSDSTKLLSLQNLVSINKNYLYGNTEKGLMIQPILSLLLNGEHSQKVIDSALTNIIYLADNERLDTQAKLCFITGTQDNPDLNLFKFYEQEALAAAAGKISMTDYTTVNNRIATAFNLLLYNKNIPYSDKEIVITDMSNSTALQTTEEISSLTQTNFNVFLAQILTDKDCPQDFIQKVVDTYSAEEWLNGSPYPTPSDVESVSDILSAAAKSPQATYANLQEINSAVHNFLSSSYSKDYDVRLACLNVMSILSRDSRLNENEQTEIKKTIEQYGITDANREIYQKYGTLVLAEDQTLLTNRLIEIIDDVLKKAPAGETPEIISLTTKITQDGYLNNLKETIRLAGGYSNINNLITIKVNSAYTDTDYLSTTSHETTHYLDDNCLTTAQRAEADKLWQESDSKDDFAWDYGMSNKMDDLATMAEAIFTDPLLPEKDRVLTKAEQQAKTGDPTLLNKYNFVEKEIWGIS